MGNDRAAAGDAGGTAGGGIVFVRDERGAGTDVEDGAGAAPEVDLAEGGGIAGGVERAGGVAGPRAEARPVVRVPAETVGPPEWVLEPETVRVLGATVGRVVAPALSATAPAEARPVPLPVPL